MTMTRNSSRDMTPRAKAVVRERPEPDEDDNEDEREGGLAGVPIMPPAAQTKTLTPDTVSTNLPGRPARIIKK